jgi:hypothetical protein
VRVSNVSRLFGVMRSRLFVLALAAYLALWAAVAAGIIYWVVGIGYSVWAAIASAFLLFIFVNGSLAYRSRARQLRLEGKEPPPYLQYLLFPKGPPKFKKEALQSTHILLGVVATAVSGGLLVLCGVGLAFDAKWSRISQPLLAAAICIFLVGIGALFLYLSWRLFSSGRKPPENVT